ncbi:MAG: MarR family transcriptional regulator [Bacillota bacterium]|nr:MarR family transcriptional regulator [Bacillota bacterium]
MESRVYKINELLVEIFNDVLTIEQNSLQSGFFQDLSITEMHTIEAIGMYESRSMTEVASQLKITVGTLTTAINRLVKKGYVERHRIEEDRRVVQIALTKRGKLAYRVHNKFHSDMVRDLITTLSEEEEVLLLSALGKLNVHLKNVYSKNQ